ncbi:MAG: Ferrous iron transport protein B [Syntrophorhabdaceae bacterium PtaU1.Bin034]|nr:MAG: Ferrous iron transport protein B [Syntrophorhabdaceae bacterium PtaU1.Bin034]
MKKDDEVYVALAGQPNCGKSTVFNVLTGAHQRVANWPGVTVDKMSGRLYVNGRSIHVIDLPGIYNFGSFSTEERVTRDFLLQENPSLVVNVVDASAVRQGLLLTLQLREMAVPLIVNLNMMDSAQKRGFTIDITALERLLGVPVVPTSMKKGQGKKELVNAISTGTDLPATGDPLYVDYGPMEPFLREMEERLSSGTDKIYPFRWAAVKLMEGDDEVEELVRRTHSDALHVTAFVQECRRAFEVQYGEAPEAHIGRSRYHLAESIARSCVTRTSAGRPLSERIDRVVCNRVMGPVMLIAVMYLLYYLSIVQGYKLTAYTWPFLATLRSMVEVLTPLPGFIEIPLARSFFLWFTDSVNALLNYIPLFFILFALIAILEDSGYMPRMAFIMDRILHRFGLHGQSILPMVLGGIYVGGCAVPAVMACKGIPDERSRLATILTIPMLNCLAKVPLYILLINAYFAIHKGVAMFFISTVSLLLVLPMAKVLTLTVLKNKETAPFVMEMPAYHLPTIRGVLGKALERLWLYLKKITTIVAAVAVVIFVLLQFPGLPAHRMAFYEDERNRLTGDFLRAVEETPYRDIVKENDPMPLILYGDAYKKARMAEASVNRQFQERNPLFFRIVKPRDPEAVKVNRAFRALVRGREKILIDMRKERLERSMLGRLGRGLEPLTTWAGFDWRINVALLSALAAKESSVATLGAIYEQDENREALETRMAHGTGLTPLHALALMLFMVLYPPCIATAIAVKTQTGSARWMLFSLGYPMVLGFLSAVLVFSSGKALGLSGIQAMVLFYGLALVLTILAGFMRQRAGGTEGLRPEGRDGEEPRSRDGQPALSSMGITRKDSPGAMKEPV